MQSLFRRHDLLASAFYKLGKFPHERKNNITMPKHSGGEIMEQRVKLDWKLYRRAILQYRNSKITREAFVFEWGYLRKKGGKA